jgi:8-amino-7-oxononanoate synthase
VPDDIGGEIEPPAGEVPMSAEALTPINEDPRYRGIEKLRRETPQYDAVVDEVNGREIRVGDHWLVDWASCNYLGFDLDPEIIASIGDQVRRWGTHPGWSRMLGSPSLYPQIEERLSALLGTTDTLVLPTISQIHLSVIPAIVGRGTIFMDGLSHKTIYDGCVHARALGASLHRFGSGNLEHLEDLLRAAGPGVRLVCLDGVNSMTGNIPDIASYARLCREFDALLYIDDAHGFGIIGERNANEACPYGLRGNAIVRYRGESYDNIILVGGFSKAYSSLLAFVAVPTGVKNRLKVTATPYLYSGPSPIASLASVLAGFDVNDARGDYLRAHVHRLTLRVLTHVRTLGVQTPNQDNTPIIELPIAAHVDLVDVAAELWRRRLYVTLAPYPGVPRDKVGFRIQVTAANTDAQVDHLNDALTALADAGVLRRAIPGPRRPAARAGDT